MASDFAIAQFQFLERLLVVHGHWCYKRIAQMVILTCCNKKILSKHFFMIEYLHAVASNSNCKSFLMQICYFFYKNIAFGFTIFYFEAFAGFSGQAIYDDWYMLLFNVCLTSLPVIALGVFEQDVDSEVCLQVSLLGPS